VHIPVSGCMMVVSTGLVNLITAHPWRQPIWLNRYIQYSVARERRKKGKQILPYFQICHSAETAVAPPSVVVDKVERACITLHEPPLIQGHQDLSVFNALMAKWRSQMLSFIIMSDKQTKTKKHIELLRHQSTTYGGVRNPNHAKIRMVNHRGPFLYF